MKDAEYIEVYQTLSEDIVRENDSRRDEIIEEMKQIESAKTVDEAATVIMWWGWDNEVRDSRSWVRKARKLLGVIE